MLYRPSTDISRPEDVWVQLFRAGPTEQTISEADYFESLRELYNQRNPHAMVGDFADPAELDFVDEPEDEENLS